MDRAGIASAGLAHALAHLGAGQCVCVVTESPEETLATVAGLVRAADLGRDRFAILTSAALADALPEVLAAAGIGLPAEIAAGRIALLADAGAPGAADLPAALVPALERLAGPWSRRFAILDVGALGPGEGDQAALALQVRLEAFAAEQGLAVLAIHDRSRLPPEVVLDAVSSHRLVVSHGVLGENLRWIPPGDLISRRRAPLDVDETLRELSARRADEAAGEPATEDLASRRLSEANERLQREIAQRVRIEHVLGASEERYRLLVEALPDCVLVHSGGAIVFVNRAGAEMVRAASPEQVLGRSVMSFVHPDSLATVAGRVRMMMEQGLRAPLMLERFVRLDGTDFYAEAIATPLVFEGRPAIQVVMRDVTERRQAEAELQFKSFLADSAIDGILVRRVSDQRLLYVNEAMCALSGFTREELLGTRERAFIPPAEREAVDRQARLIAEQGRGIFETSVLTASGEEIPVEIHSVAVRYGEELVLVSILRDVSERRRAEARQRLLAEQLERAQRMEAIGTLASGVAHDFNNILVGILGYAEVILQRTREGDPFHRAATVIAQAAERGAGLARRILTVARKERLEPRPVDANRLVRESADLLRRTLPADVALELRLAEGLPPVLADPAQVDQVIMNLATNARDAMPAGGRIVIETALADADELPVEARGASGRFLRLTVADAGAGMDEETRRRIFDPFFTTKGAGRGTGLGLFIVHTVVGHHGGFLAVESEPGRGTRISVFLPVATAEAEGGERPPADLRGTGTVLVIDDEPMVRDTCRDLLTPLGYTVLTAGGGEEGLALFGARAEGIDLVVLDLVMPGMSGGEVFERLRRIRLDVPVLLCSGYSPEGNEGIQALIAAGARGFVQKPFTRAAIATAVKEAKPADKGPSASLSGSRPPAT